MLSDKKRQTICGAVAKILRAERIKAGLSMTRLSARAGLSQQSVSYLERQLRVPNLDTLLRICEALQIDLAKVISRAAKAHVKQ
jgi:transcriptional regulator with XRE-family HTH domain